MDRQGKRDKEAGQRWWQDWRWIAAVAAVIFAVGFGSFVRSIIPTNESVQEAEPVLTELRHLAEDNAKTLDALERSQAGIDELVEFVRDVKAQQENGEEVDLQIFVDLLCASNDPARQAACDELLSTGGSP